MFYTNVLLHKLIHHVIYCFSMCIISFFLRGLFTGSPISVTIYAPMNSTVGQNVTLVCQSSACNPPCRIIWFLRLNQLGDASEKQVVSSEV